VGFVFRDEAGGSVLVGTLSGSVDRVGRRFPLALFCELSAPEGLWFPALPVALGPVLEQLGAIAHRAARYSQAELVAKLDAVVAPTGAALVDACARERERADSAPGDEILQRLLGTVDERCFAIETLHRACDGARRSRAVKNPVVLDGPIHSDLELIFWLSCVEVGLGGAIGVPSLLWDVTAERVLVVLGTPEANALHCLWGPGAQYQRLWPTTTASPEARRRARERLPGGCLALLEDPGGHPARALIDGIATLG
jgi:type VI secretion system protein ImpM